MKIYVVFHRPEGDAFNTYEGMTQDQIVAMASETWPGTTCEFIDQPSWSAKLDVQVETVMAAAAVAKGVSVAPSSPA